MVNVRGRNPIQSNHRRKENDYSSLWKWYLRNNQINQKNMNTNTKGTLLAIGIMVVIIALGIMYGVQLEKSFYISNTY